MEVNDRIEVISVDDCDKDFFSLGMEGVVLGTIDASAEDPLYAVRFLGAKEDEEWYVKESQMKLLPPATKYLIGQRLVLCDEEIVQFFRDSNPEGPFLQIIKAFALLPIDVLRTDVKPLPNGQL